MSKLFKNISLLLSLLTVLLLTNCGKGSGQQIITSTDNNAETTKPIEIASPDFGFVLNYGIGAKNQLDTFKGTYTKDMVTVSNVTTDLKLSQEELNEIYTSMKRINILSYPEVYSPKTNTAVTPYSTYIIKIAIDGKTKNIYYEDESVSQSKEAVNLRSLFNRIHEIISQKNEYKKLPEPVGGYD